jgi:hypothetical protein
MVKRVVLQQVLKHCTKAQRYLISGTPLCLKSIKRITHRSGICSSK